MDPRKPPVSPDSALASDVFDQFCSASTLKTILALYRHLCDLLKLRPTNFHQFYPKLKSKLGSWKAQALWNKFDKRASHKCYNRGRATPNTRVLIIGAGPCGLRAAIEAQLLGAKVVVVEKRDRISRNNVLHLWPFVIHDLRALGAKKFFGKFCAGAIDHISIRQLQVILLKVALLFGVEVHVGVGFEKLLPPPVDQTEKIGWRALVDPPDHPVSQYEFDVLIGADGKRNTLEGFGRKEFRGKLAIAITANFINRRSEAEARVEEISGVAFIFNQKFFRELYQATGIDLENIVYYKDETHYFVMTAKKHSLINKGVIIKDQPDTYKLLSPDNVDKEALMEYAREAADFSTLYQLPHLEFAVNHYGQPDVAMFDFTSMYAAENASRVLEKHGHKLLLALVGDSLLEPFWPTGSGCARGFLSSMDACWAVRSWGSGQMTPLEVLSERESIYRLLGQTTPENLHKDLTGYSLDPHSRYPNLNLRAVVPIQAKNLFDTDNLASLEVPLPQEIPKKKRRKDSQVHPDTLLLWLKRQVALFDNVRIEDMTTSFKNGIALCAIIYRYRPDLLDFSKLKPEDSLYNNQLAFELLDREMGITPVMTVAEMEESEVPDHLAMLTYLSQVYDAFRGEIPHIRPAKLEDLEELRVIKAKSVVPSLASLHKMLPNIAGSHTKPGAIAAHKVSVPRASQRLSATRKRSSLDRDAALGLPDRKSGGGGGGDTLRRAARKRRSMDKDLISENRRKVQEDIQQNREERMMRRKMMRHLSNQQFIKSMQMLQSGRHGSDEEGDGRFEDYSIYLYRQTADDFSDRINAMEQKLRYPDRDARILAEIRRANPDVDFSGRIKELEAKLKGSAAPSEKKPKDLLRSIGKIEHSDWNVKEIERKMEENKMGRGKHHRAERVPKWSREKFADKFSAVEKKLAKGRNKEDEGRFEALDSTLRRLDRKIREGSTLDQCGPRGSNKVSAMAEQFTTRSDPEKPASSTELQKSSSKTTVVVPAQGGSENCHFCDKRVYLMERLSAEGRFFHRGCFRCEYCGTSLRLNTYAFDRDGKFGSRFVCGQHFGLVGVARGARARRKSEDLRAVAQEEALLMDIHHKVASKKKSDDKLMASSSPVLGSLVTDGRSSGTPERVEFENVEEDQNDKMGVTPERIEFENHSVSEDEVSEARLPPGMSEMDEDEWTDHNFGASCADDDSSSDENSSSLSDSEDEEEVFEEALGEPLSVEETRQLAEDWKRRYSQRTNQPSALNGDNNSDDSCDDSEDEWSFERDENEDEDSSTATEGEEGAVARELRRQEERLRERAKHRRRRRENSRGSDTEVASDYSSTETESDDDEELEEEEEENLATEIETDSEFELDASLPTIVIDSEIQVCQVKSGVVKGHINQNSAQPNRFHATKPVISKPSVPPLEMTPAILRHRQHEVPANNMMLRAKEALNRTNSTEGIASKMSLELKKKYLLGADSHPFAGNVHKSGSASALDSRFRSFVDQISEHQKLLQPAAQPSPTMQAFLDGQAKISPSKSGSPLLTSLSTSNILQYRRSDSIGKLPNPPSNFLHICGKNEKVLGPPKIKVTTEEEEEDGRGDIQDEATPIVEIKELPSIVNNVETIISQNIPDSPEIKIAPSKIDSPKNENPKENSWVETNILDPDYRPRSPAHETSIIVPDISKWKERSNEEAVLSKSSSSESESSSSEYEDDAEGVALKDENVSPPKQNVPRLEITDSEGSVMHTDVPVQALESDNSSPGKNNDDYVHTETELSDWAQDSEGNSMGEEVFHVDAKNVTFRKRRKRGLVPALAYEDDLSGTSLQEDCAKVDIMIVNDTIAPVPNQPLLNEKISEKLEKSPEEAPKSIYAFESPKIERVDVITIADSITPKSLGASLGDDIDFMDSEESDVEIEPIVSSQEPVIDLIVNSESKNLEAIPAEFLVTTEGYRQLNEEVTDVAPANDSSTSESISKSTDSFGTRTTPDTELEILVPVEAINAAVAKTSDEESLLLVDTDTISDVTTFIFNDTNRNVALPQNDNEKIKRHFIDPTYEAHVRRLQGRISPFSNAKDSIDIRKSRKSSSNSSSGTSTPISPGTPSKTNNENAALKKFSPSSPTLKIKTVNSDNTVLPLSPTKVQNKNYALTNTRMIGTSPSTPVFSLPNVLDKNTLSSSPSYENSTKDLSKKVENQKLPDQSTKKSNGPLKCVPITPGTSRKLEEISKERSKQKDLIADLVIGKLGSNSLERKRTLSGGTGIRKRLSSKSPTGSPRASLMGHPPPPVPEPPVIEPPPAAIELIPITPHSSAKENYNDDVFVTPKPGNIKRRPISASFKTQDIPKGFYTTTKLPETPLTHPETFSCPDIRRALFVEENRERARLEARMRARLKSDQELGLSPEDIATLSSLREKARKVMNEESNYQNETPVAPPRTKKQQKSNSSKFYLDPDNSQSAEDTKTDPVVVRRPKKPGKDRERRKSLIQAMSEFFSRKKENPQSPGSPSSVSTPESKSTPKHSKSPVKLQSPSKSKEKLKISREELNTASNLKAEEVPPPIPPPPRGYEGCTSFDYQPSGPGEDSVSEGEDSRSGAVSMASQDGSMRRSARGARKAARQAQLKRLRMAHELQRQLAELEVKQRALETRGVTLEKALRGERPTPFDPEACMPSQGGEVALLQEWFNLMRERSELARYEQELGIRAQELELQERHARLQSQLRERMALDDSAKTKVEVEEEGRILNEMLEIVERRDSLIALLEDDRQRYQAEDQDLEAQMLAKGLQLTSIRKESHV